jgi:hypothetical protein
VEVLMHLYLPLGTSRTSRISQGTSFSSPRSPRPAAPAGVVTRPAHAENSTQAFSKAVILKIRAVITWMVQSNTGQITLEIVFSSSIRMASTPQGPFFRTIIPSMRWPTLVEACSTRGSSSTTCICKSSRYLGPT